MHFTSPKFTHSGHSHTQETHQKKNSIIHYTGIPTRSCTRIPTGYIEIVYRIGIEEFRRDIMGVGHCKQSKEVGSVITSLFTSK